MATVLVLGAGCTSDDGDAAAGPTATGEAATRAEDTTTTDDATTGTTGDETSTTGADDEGGDQGGDAEGGDQGGDAALPGDPWVGFAQAGDELAVFGVAHDDVLNIRALPGAEGEIVATAEPSATDVVATGEARELSRSFWYQVEVDGVTGWARVRYLAFPGSVDDATAELLDHATGGELPETETMLEMGQLVAEGFATTDPVSTIVQSGPASVGDLGEITFDVVGIGDDAAVGYRLHVFGAPSESGEGFSLESIERTTFCGRGSHGELCV
jgi:hypothetical protein